MSRSNNIGASKKRVEFQAEGAATTSIPLTKLGSNSSSSATMSRNQKVAALDSDGTLTAEELRELNASFPPSRRSRRHSSEHDPEADRDSNDDERAGLLFKADMSDMDSDEEMELEMELTRVSQPSPRSKHQRRGTPSATFLQDKHRMLFSHPFYHPVRFVLLIVSAVLIILILVVGTRSLIHSLTHHAPGSIHPSSITHLATSLDRAAKLSNGTHDFRRTVVLISLDGNKPIYLDQGLAPHLQNLGMSSTGKEGHGSRRAQSMQPVFPTLTFPNHWSILTGLYAESHGIVANDFHVSPSEPPPSSSSGRRFYYTDPSKSWDPAWWGGTPIWASAERSGVDAAVLMWPGPPRTQQGDRPKYFQKYEEGPKWDLDGRLRQIMHWLDLKIEKRPQLICAYAPDIDKAAHKFGPDSKEAHQAVEQVDQFIGRLSEELDRRNLSSIVDVLVVSDHGMTETSNQRLVFLDDVLGSKLMSQIETQDGWPSVGLRFKGSTEEIKERNLEEAYFKLTNYSSTLQAQQGGGARGFQVYRRAELPERYHYSLSSRVADLWAIPELGWSFTTHQELNSFADQIYAPKGNHGYDNKESDMQAIFVARGPSFTPLPTTMTTKHNMQPFPNLEIYNLVAKILGLPPDRTANNNGTQHFWNHHLQPHLLNATSSVAIAAA